LVKEGADATALICVPVSTSKLDTPWYLSADCSAGG
jgi:hypothetical protein